LSKPSKSFWHPLGMLARDLTRIADCMLREGHWKDQ
jgi:CubicO group peptidase (beta-lactamase class C family)